MRVRVLASGMGNAIEVSMATIQTRLKPGTYRLREDVPPLRVDKRRTRDWRYNPIKAGMRFFYKEWTYSPRDDEFKITEHRLYPVGDYEHDSVTPDESTNTRILEELLERVEETPSLWIRREHGGWYALEVLDRLWADGTISMAQVQEHAARVDGEES